MPQSVRAGIAEMVKRFGRIDILVNNAGSAGPKQPIENMPLDRDELAALQKRGSNDTETVGDAMRNIFGVALEPRRARQRRSWARAARSSTSRPYSRARNIMRAPPMSCPRRR